MDSRVLLPLVFVCCITAPLYAEPIAATKPRLDPELDSEQRAIQVLREWSVECRTFKSVLGKFHRIEYDGVFQVQKHAEGEFGYLGPRHGFWRFRPLVPLLSARRKKGRDGKLYTLKVSESEHWRWQKTRLLLINEDDRNYEEHIFPNKPMQKQRTAWYFFSSLLTVDGISPFIPGVPNQARFDDFLKHCKLMVTKESETHIWIAGKPNRRKEAALYREFKLYLEKKPWRLRAIQYFHPAGNRQTVYIFSNIKMNPPEWDEPDLSGYQNLSKKIDQSVLVARKPVKTGKGTSLSDVWFAFRIGLFIVDAVL